MFFQFSGKISRQCIEFHLKKIQKQALDLKIGKSVKFQKEKKKTDNRKT